MKKLSNKEILKKQQMNSGRSVFISPVRPLVLPWMSLAAVKIQPALHLEYKAATLSPTNTLIRKHGIKLTVRE